MSRFLVICGGTGGHLSPGIAVAEALDAQGHECRLMISKKDVDSRLVQKYGHLRFERSPGCGLSRKPLEFLRFCFEQCSAVVFALWLVLRFKPAAVISFGGFLTPGAVLAAKALKVPVVLHEANRRPGRSIRILSGLAARIYLPEGVNLRGLPPRTLRYCGYPLRKEIRRINKDQARRNLGLKLGGKLVLVLGGSQGAQSLNDWVSRNFDALARENISVYCITGMDKGTQGAIEQMSDQGQVCRATFVPFSDRMTDVLSAADMVVARAGAGSIAEIVHCRVPCILVPFPHAADNHQLANARFLEQQGACVTVEQKDIGNLLAEVLATVFNDWLLRRLRQNMARIDRENATDIIVRDLLALAAEEDEDND